LRDWRQDIESDAINNFLSEKEEIQLKASIMAKHSAVKDDEEGGRCVIWGYNISNQPKEAKRNHHLYKQQ